MPLLNFNTKLADVVLADPSVVTVLNRFGIVLGVGDSTVKMACDNLGLDAQFLVNILNAYLNPDYFPEDAQQGFDAKLIISYLDKTNSYYEQYSIPNIERHFGFLISKSGTDNNLPIMLKFFIEVKAELLKRIDEDRRSWFPQIIDLDAKQQGLQFAEPVKATEDEESDTIEDKIDDLVNMIVMHLKGSYDLNLCQAVLIALTSLKKDIVQNNRIRNRILRPVFSALIQDL